MKFIIITFLSIFAISAQGFETLHCAAYQQNPCSYDLNSMVDFCVLDVTLTRTNGDFIKTSYRKHFVNTKKETFHDSTDISETVVGDPNEVVVNIWQKNNKISYLVDDGEYFTGALFLNLEKGKVTEFNIRCLPQN